MQRSQWHHLHHTSLDARLQLVQDRDPAGGVVAEVVSGEALRAMHGDSVADAVRVLYDGSVKSSNVGELMQRADVDGALVGGASLKAEEFAKIAGFQG